MRIARVLLFFAAIGAVAAAAPPPTPTRAAGSCPTTTCSAGLTICITPPASTAPAVRPGDGGAGKSFLRP